MGLLLLQTETFSNNTRRKNKGVQVWRACSDGASAPTHLSNPRWRWRLTFTRMRASGSDLVVSRGMIALLAEGRPTFWQKQRHSYLVFTERLCLGRESPIYSIIQVLLHLFSYWPKGIQAMLAEIGAVSPYGFRDFSSK